MSVSFRDKDGTTRLDGDLLASGGATGDVLTQQADGTFAPAATAAFNGGTITDPLEIDNGTNATPALIVKASPSPAGNTFEVQRNSDGKKLVQVDDVGDVDLTSGSGSMRLRLLSETGAVAGISISTTNGLFFGDSTTGATLFRAIASGAFSTAAHAAPSDGTLAAGEMFIWFDQTNGAAKLMIKAKTANGTVVTGNVALA